MDRRILLFPAGLRLPGYILATAGLSLLFLRYKFNFEPDFLDIKFFAFLAYYIKAKVFAVIQHQMIEELGGVLLIVGLFLIAFTKEKAETESMNGIRLKAFYVSSYFNLVYVVLSILFFYGFGFVGALTFFAAGWLLFYILVFRYLLYKSLKK
jgi:hypothetical protein